MEIYHYPSGRQEVRRQEYTYANIFKKNDKRTIYNVCYRDGKEGTSYIKRFAVTSVVRDREYDVTQGTPDSRITYFTANPNAKPKSSR